MSENKMDIGGLYKLKEGKSLDIEDNLSRYVRLLGFARNPLEQDGFYCEFIYVYKEDLTPTTMIHPLKILPYNRFLEYFELGVSSIQVNELIYQLKKEGKCMEF